MIMKENDISFHGLKDINLESRIVLFGCGGHARSIINALQEYKKDLEIILIDKNAEDYEFILGYEVKRDYKLRENDNYIVAVGDNTERKRIYDYLQKKHKGNGISIRSLYSCIGMASKIGKGTYIAPFAWIGPQADIGYNTIINTGSVIEHEVIIGNNTHIAPHATICGRSKIGNEVFCGAGSTIIDKITVCNNVIIGAGAVVKDNIMQPGTYIGIPAKRTK